MDKKDIIIDYYLGIHAYNSFLLKYLFNFPLDFNFILNKRYFNAAWMGVISSLFIALKEKMIDKNNNILLPFVVMEENVQYIADKVSTGYKIDGYIFKDSNSVVTTLRNKIAHGDYIMDFEHNRVILNVDNNDVVIPIGKLSAFTLKCFSTITMNNKTPSFSVSIIDSKAKSNKSKERYSVEDYKNMILSCYKYNITIKRKDGKNIEGYILNKFNDITNLFFKTFDLNLLINFEKEIKEDYSLTWNKLSLKGENITELATYLSNLISENAPYNRVIECVKIEVQNWLNSKRFENYSIIEAGVYNLILLDILKKVNTTNCSVVRQELYSHYKLDYLSSNIFPQNLIAQFNALFSYGYDDVLHNRNEYQSLELEGFDYSLIDTSMFNIEVEKNDDGYISDLQKKLNSIKGNIDKLNNALISCSSNLTKVTLLGSEKGISTITSQIEEINRKINILNNNLESVQITFDNANEYINKYPNLIKNEKTINGIRDSIAHGSYKLIYGKDFKNSIIEFTDFYNGKIIFKANITVRDFLAFLTNSALKINLYLHPEREKLPLFYVIR